MSVGSSRHDGSGRRLPLSALVGAAVCWGVVTPAEKYAVVQLGSLTTLLIECLAAVLLVIVSLRGGQPRSVQLWRYALLGLLEPGLAFGALDVGLRYTSAGSAALLDGLQPCFLLVLGAVFLNERITARSGIAVGVATGGVVVLTAWHATFSVGGGDALVLVASLAASSASIVISRLSRHANARQITSFQLLFGTLWGALFAGVAWSTGSEQLPTTRDWHPLMIAGLAGIVGLLIASALYNFAVARVAARTAGMSLTLIPVVGVVAAVISLGEKIAAGQLIGGSLILIGMLMYAFGDGQASG